MDALDTNYNDRYFDGNDSSASMASACLNRSFSNARTSFLLVNYNDAETVLTNFDKAFAQTAASITPYQFGADEYREFVYGGYTHFTCSAQGESKSFLNNITFNPFRTENENTVSEIHEKIHAIQWDVVPELHAIPYNMLAYQEVPIILSPRSWILASLLTEREAYAKTAWLAKLIDDYTGSNELEMAMKNELVQPKDIKYWHARYPDDIGFALGETSLIWDELIRAKRRDDGSKINLKDHYVELAIRQYNEKNSPRLHSWETAADPVFIDLDDQAILAMGASFGPSIFGKYYPDPVFKDLKLTSEQEEQVRALEKKFGIEPNQKLPTLRQELARHGMSVEEYMNRSKTFIDRPPVPQPQEELSIAL